MAEPRTSVVVSHLDVIYEVFGAKKGVAAAQSGPGVVDRLLRRDKDRIGHVQRIHAVKDVSFTAQHGESIGIIGRNGSGKSTLLRAVAGLIPPAAGEVHLAGNPSLLGVNAVLMPELTGERNIMIGGQALGLTPAEIRARFDDIVEFSGIGDFVYLPMRAYSSGMGARLRFAISTAAVPDILMVDEALATGDADFQARSTERINEIREAAGTVFLVSHSNAHIRQMCTRALWMDDGRLIADGPAGEVVDLYQKTFAKPKPAQKKPAPTAPTPAGEPAPTSGAPAARPTEPTA